MPASDPARDLLPRLLQMGRALLRLGYFSVEVEGMEHVPREGRVVFAANHAGWFPVDAFVLGFVLGEAHGPSRAPYFATADAALAAPLLGRFMRRAGALPASWFRRPERLPPEVESIGIFPEGVRGNCKPFWEAYRMREWNRGFVRAAMARDAPVVPVAILGGEECVPVGWTVRLLEPVIGSILPLPLTLVPLPGRWKLVFHEPVVVRGVKTVAGEGRGGGPAAEAKRAMADPDFQSEVARRVRRIVQGTLDREALRFPLGRLSALTARTRPPSTAPPGVDADPLDR